MAVESELASRIDDDDEDKVLNTLLICEFSTYVVCFAKSNIHMCGKKLFSFLGIFTYIH